MLSCKGSLQRTVHPPPPLCEGRTQSHISKRKDFAPTVSLEICIGNISWRWHIYKQVESTQKGLSLCSQLRKIWHSPDFIKSRNIYLIHCMVSEVLDIWPYFNCFTFDSIEEKIQKKLPNGSGGHQWSLLSTQTRWRLQHKLTKERKFIDIAAP